jgi:hypothetical protein
VSTMEFYRARADQCSREAEATALTNVRDRQLAARDVWLEMADRLERASVSRAETAAEKERLATAAVL